MEVMALAMAVRRSTVEESENGASEPEIFASDDINGINGECGTALIKFPI